MVDVPVLVLLMCSVLGNEFEFGPKDLGSLHAIHFVFCRKNINHCSDVKLNASAKLSTSTQPYQAQTEDKTNRGAMAARSTVVVGVS